MVSIHIATVSLDFQRLDLFKTNYGFKAGVGGLAYLGLGIGFVLSAILGAKFANQVYLKVRTLHARLVACSNIPMAAI